MAYDMLPHCPDYIKDFPDIQNLANAQGLIYNSVLIKISGVMANACFVTKNDTWESVLGIDYSDNWQDRTFRMLRRYEYVSFEEYTKLVECFLGDSFSLTIDYESLSVVIKTTKIKNLRN